MPCPPPVLRRHVNTPPNLTKSSCSLHNHQSLNASLPRTSTLVAFRTAFRTLLSILNSQCNNAIAHLLAPSPRLPTLAPSLLAIALTTNFLVSCVDRPGRLTLAFLYAVSPSSPHFSSCGVQISSRCALQHAAATQMGLEELTVLLDSWAPLALLLEHVEPLEGINMNRKCRGCGLKSPYLDIRRIVLSGRKGVFVKDSHQDNRSGRERSHCGACSCGWPGCRRFLFRSRAAHRFALLPG